MVVSRGAPAGSSQFVEIDALADDDSLRDAEAWMEHLWPQAA
jgi:hypothetical protein